MYDDISHHNFYCKIYELSILPNIFLKWIFLDLNGQFRLLYQWKLYNFLLKKNSSTAKTPNLPYLASKSAKKRMKNNCWTKTVNLDQCAVLGSRYHFSPAPSKKAWLRLLGAVFKNFFNRLRLQICLKRLDSRLLLLLRLSIIIFNGFGSGSP